MTVNKELIFLHELSKELLKPYIIHFEMGIGRIIILRCLKSHERAVINEFQNLFDIENLEIITNILSEFVNKSIDIDTDELICHELSFILANLIKGSK